mmetsp:Transcript_110278/g.172410  ORF Transcript_110278/g.172410 Transcript_110278/m.172410 type:complete len:604 (+) Transcript_110278:87-1898(+)
MDVAEEFPSSPCCDIEHPKTPPSNAVGLSPLVLLGREIGCQTDARSPKTPNSLRAKLPRLRGVTCSLAKHYFEQGILHHGFSSGAGDKIILALKGFSKTLESVSFMREQTKSYITTRNLMAFVGMLVSKDELMVVDVLKAAGELQSFGTSICFVLMDWTISLLVSGFGLVVAYVFSKLDWENNFDVLYMTVIVGSIFTAWNIAQYASYAIQTTGHQNFRDHLHAIKNVGCCLLTSNLIGWSLCLACLQLSHRASSLVRALVVLIPSISSGIVGKTVCKLRYFKRYELARQDLADEDMDDALSWKMRRDVRPTAHLCPFKRLTACVVFRHAAGPGTCFAFTLVYTVGLRIMYDVVDPIADSLTKTIAKFLIFLGSNIFFVIGNSLLNRWICKSEGVMTYSSKMCMAFYFIYGTVTELQIRFGLVQFEGVSRTACSFIHPLVVTFIRLNNFIKFRRTFRKLRDTNQQWIQQLQQGAKPGDSEHDEVISQHSIANAAVNRYVLFIMSSMITQNVSGVILTGMACIFENSNKLFVGSCPDGFWIQIVKDNTPTWIGDFMTIANLTSIGVPVFYYFLLLDPFMIVAVLVVVYMSVCLVLFTAGISVAF